MGGKDKMGMPPMISLEAAHLANMHNKVGSAMDLANQVVSSRN